MVLRSVPPEDRVSGADLRLLRERQV